MQEPKPELLDLEAKRRAYLARMRDAEDAAAKAADPADKDAWEKIAERYRKLVKLTE